jgi:hypothetical protein
MFNGFGKIWRMLINIDTANDLQIVGCVDKVKEIGKNYAVFNSRLQKMYPPGSFTIRTKDESPKIPTFSFNMCKFNLLLILNSSCEEIH